MSVPVQVISIEEREAKLLRAERPAPRLKVNSTYVFREVFRTLVSSTIAADVVFA